MTTDGFAADAESTGLIKRTDAAPPPSADPAAAGVALASAGSGAVATMAPSTPAVTTTAVTTTATVTTTAAVMPPPATEFITCPECGTTAQVTLNRRDSVDFCRTCDYPLFWSPSKIYRDPTETDESLRRLPGTVGRATIASLACPFCYEPNALTAETCVRCGRPMHPVAEAPAPEPVYVPPPPPAPAPEPKARVAWWVWVLLALGAAALITLIVLIATHTIH